ncbi:MAG TPA: CotH kinase family protein, partial [Methylomirabilota bacterium]|nr:CotH kinase family protein [Methylomirabilota bacterium]
MKSRVVPVVWLFVVLGVLPLAARSEVRITEFMASNSNTLADEDGDFEDWIELHNSGPEAVNLEGWFLTDDAGDPMQWPFPAISLAPDEYRVVFASGKDRRTPGEPLHTNFRISIDGEYLALLDPELNVHSGFVPRFPAQVRDVSFGIGTLKETQSLVAAGSPARVLIPRDGSLGLDWIQPDFDGVGWSTCTAAIGYENAPADYAGLILTDLSRYMSGVNGSCYLRVPFVIESLSELSNFRLRVRHDDGFVGWLNGEEIGRRNAPDVLAWNSFALADHPDAEAVEPEVFPLTPFLDRLVAGTNWLAFQGLNVSLSSSDFLLTVELEADRVVEERSGWRYFQTPTPGEPNAGGDISVGPILHSAAHQPNVPAASDPLQVTVEVAAGLAPVESVSLHYRVMFGAEITVTMFDDGAHGDGAAGDGVHGAMIPGGAGASGQMIRYRITATDVAGDSSRLPLFHDPLDSGEYFGTVVHNPQIQSELPVVHLFVSNVGAGETRAGTRASLFYLDELYDNIEITLRGQSTSGFPKKGHNLDFNRDHRFRPSPDAGRVKDIKLLTNWADKSRVRNTLAYEVIEWAGSVGHFGFPVRVQRNGAFHAILDLLEDGDDRWLERVGRDPEGALYKMYNALNGAGGNEKKTRRDEDFSDLQTLVNELSTSRPLADRVRYAWDNLDLPQTISYFAALALISSQDHGHKNYYVYRDTRGSGEWTILPWDVDLSFGRNWTHEFSYLHDALYQDNRLDFYNAPQQNKPANRLYELIFDHPEFRAMYLRRFRTLMDTILQPPGTAEEELLIEARIREWVELLDPPGISPSDTDLDYSRWGSWGNQNSTRAEAQRIIDIHLPGRRAFLFENP